MPDIPKLHMVARCHANALLHSAKDCPRLDSHCHRIATQRLRCSKQDFAAAILCYSLHCHYNTMLCRNRAQQCFALLRLNCTSPSYAKTVLHKAITSHASVRTPLTVTICHRNIFSAAFAANVCDEDVYTRSLPVVLHAGAVMARRDAAVVVGQHARLYEDVERGL